MANISIETQIEVMDLLLYFRVYGRSRLWEFTLHKILDQVVNSPTKWR